MGKKVNLKGGKNLRDVGKAIFKLWEDAEKAGKSSLDKADVQTAFDGLLDNKAAGGKKSVVFDFILDQEIDPDTRMVWICLPVPEADKGGNSWKQYVKKFKQDATADPKMYDDLGKAALFGCGR